MGQVDAGEMLRVGHLRKEFDGALPVPRGLGVAEHPLGGLGRAHPGRQLLGGTAGGGPVPGSLRGERVIAGRLQRPRQALVQRGPLTGQQLGGHRLGQQSMPRPLLAADAAVGQQPRSGQLPQPAADIVDVQPAHGPEQILAQRPARHRQRRQHRPGRPAAAGRPRHQQLRQPRRQPDPGAQHALAARRPPRAAR